MTKFKKYYWILISVLIVALDQITKVLIRRMFEPYREVNVIKNFFSLTYVKNEGIAFGAFSKFGFASKIIIIVLTLTLIVLTVTLLLKGVVYRNLGVISLAMIIGGGIGNLIDRVFIHFVTDFFAFTFFGKDFAVFNVADIFVTVGTALFVLYFLFFEKDNHEKVVLPEEKADDGIDEL